MIELIFDKNMVVLTQIASNMMNGTRDMKTRGGDSVVGKVRRRLFLSLLLIKSLL